MRLMTLVPNHLSTQKSTNPHPPYCTLNPQNHQKTTTLHNKNTPQKGVEKEKSKDEGAGEV